MKLNKKGFAFSTMLYGSIAIIAALLYLILNINKKSVDTTYYFKEEVLKDLNECVLAEVELENCYLSGSESCSTLSYHSCLGINDNTVEKGTIISEIIKDTAVINPSTREYMNPYTSNGANGLYKDPYQSGRFIYYGDSANNYIQFSGKTWRIISVELGGYLKLIDINKLATIAWDTDGNGVWGSNSTLSSTLNNNYKTSITEAGSLYSVKWPKTVLYPSSEDTFDINNLITLERTALSEEQEVAYVGLVSLSDYIKATKNNKCRSDIFGNDTYDCYSWLSAYSSWTIDINGENGSDTEGYAYYIGDETLGGVLRHNRFVFKRTNQTNDVYPVIYLDRNKVYKSGTGTISDPYILK